jgi:aspartate carbamoyltransferase catalytic subunit
MTFPENLFSIRSISDDHIRSFLEQAFQFKSSLDPHQVHPVLKGKTVLQFFTENSTRTKMSFEAATRRLGGASISFAQQQSSLAKGETLKDTAQTIFQYGVDAVVVRNRSSGSPELFHEWLHVPIINAGDGQHEHPTQALLDAMTLMEHFALEEFTRPSGSSPVPSSQILEGKLIYILGDVLHSRVARSNIHLLSRLGANVVLGGPPTLIPRDLSLFPKVEVDCHPDRVLPEADAVMMLRVQYERQEAGFFPSKEEYRHFWGLTADRVGLLKKSAAILHPGPVNRGLEIDPEATECSQSLILKQVENGVWMRMSVLAGLLGGRS